MIEDKRRSGWKSTKHVEIKSNNY